MYFLFGFLGGLCFLPCLPSDWFLSACLAWSVSWATEAWIHRRRVWSLESSVSSAEFATVLAFGFIWKLGLLLLGALAGHVFNLFPPRPFLWVFLLGLFLGEAWSLPKVYRMTKP